MLLPNSARPRILIVSERFYPIIGGAERQAINLSNYLKKKNYYATVLTRRVTKELPKTEKMNGIDIYRLPLPGLNNFSKYIFTLLLPIYYFIFRKKYDIIYFYDIFGVDGLISIVSSKLMNKKIVGIYNNIGIDKVGILSKFIKSKLLNYCDAIVCASKEVLNESLNLKIKKEKHVLIRHSFDTKFIRPPTKNEKGKLRKKLDMNVDNIVLYIGKMVPHKHPELLAKAWQMLKSTKYYKKSSLLFIGSGKWQSKSIETEVKNFISLNALNNVKFIENTYEIDNYYKAGDILVNPAEKDLPSNVVLEAMLSGMIVIAADITPNKEVITPYKNGILFQKNDYVDLFNKLVKIISNKKMRKTISENASKIKEFYDVDIVNKQYEILFRNVLKSKLSQQLI